MKTDLCTALAKHLGETLTVDLAVLLVRELFPDLAHAPEKFGVASYKGYTFQVERLAAVLPELHPLHQAHYAETELYRASIPMMPNYGGMKEREQAGQLIQFTARSAIGELVGHMRVYVSPSQHTDTLIATEDSFYVMPEHRGGFLAVRLWQFVERSVIAIGVREIYFSSKLVNKADAMARYLKYQPIATRFAKVIGDPTQAQECLSLLKEKPCAHPTPPTTAD